MNRKQAEQLCESRIKEEAIHMACAAWIEVKAQTDDRYKWFHHSPNGGKRHIGTAVKLKKMGVRRGFPDFINMLPSNGFNGLAVELKRPGGKLTKEQREWMEFFRSIGYRCAVCDNVDGFKEGVEEYFL